MGAALERHELQGEVERLAGLKASLEGQLADATDRLRRLQVWRHTLRCRQGRDGAGRLCCVHARTHARTRATIADATERGVLAAATFSPLAAASHLCHVACLHACICRTRRYSWPR